jgi:hypothetical protein
VNLPTSTFLATLRLPPPMVMDMLFSAALLLVLHSGQTRHDTGTPPQQLFNSHPVFFNANLLQQNTKWNQKKLAMTKKKSWLEMWNENYTIPGRWYPGNTNQILWELINLRKSKTFSSPHMFTLWQIVEDTSQENNRYGMLAWITGANSPRPNVHRTFPYLTLGRDKKISSVH